MFLSSPLSLHLSTYTNSASVSLSTIIFFINFLVLSLSLPLSFSLTLFLSFNSTTHPCSRTFSYFHIFPTQGKLHNSLCFSPLLSLSHLFALYLFCFLTRILIFLLPLSLSLFTSTLFPHFLTRLHPLWVSSNEWLCRVEAKAINHRRRRSVSSSPWHHFLPVKEICSKKNLVGKGKEFTHLRMAGQGWLTDVQSTWLILFYSHTSLLH